MKIQSNISEQENNQQIIYDLLNIETKAQFLCLRYRKQSSFLFYSYFFAEKNVFF